MKNSIHLLFIVALNATLLNCNRDEVQAKNSIEGNWQVSSLTLSTGVFDGGSFTSTDKITETGQLGTFNFTENLVEYDFSIGNETYTGDELWTIKTEKVNAGFTRVNQHTLTIQNQFIFDVTFEDGTKNAEKNASSMTFTKAPTAAQPFALSLLLEQN